MKIFIFFLIILISGCSQKNEYNNIEVLTYSWKHGNYKNINDGFYIHCSTYSKIYKSGKAITFSDHSFFNREPFYFTNAIDNELIDSVITIMKSGKHNFSDKKIYDGPCIRIKINLKNQVSEIYTFPMIIEDPKFASISNLYQSFVHPKEITLIKRLQKLDNDKDIFIAQAMKHDTLRVPLPPEQ